jgi:hypothetical protein
LVDFVFKLLDSVVDFYKGVPVLVQVVYGAREVNQEGSGYTYKTDIKDLQIGDIVMVPPTPFSDGEQEATVVSLSSDYAGMAKKVLHLVRRRGESAKPT